MTATIIPAPLRGAVRAIASKSAAHRLLICAAFADAETEIVCPDTSKDIEATIDCLNSLGAGIVRRGTSLFVSPIAGTRKNAALDCGESGSTLRFMLPVCCALGAGASIRMHGRLPERPLSPLWEELTAHGAEISHPERETLLISGAASGRDWSIDGGVSSQFVSGILFSLPLIGGGELAVTGRAESSGYIDMTVSAMLKFGVNVVKTERGYAVSGAYRTPGRAEVEGDWSNAAFWLAAAELCGGEVTCTGLDDASGQGDRAVRDILPALGGGCVVDARDIPDLVPILAVTASLRRGDTTFINAGRLRLKESDRISSTCAMINSLGGSAEETADGIAVHGTGSLCGGTVDSCGDHRIAMCAAIASIGCTGRVRVLGAECTQKSYPQFWRDFADLGGKVSMED